METVTITKEEYERLLKEEQYLSALRFAGVDNWQGIDCAHELLREWEGENEDS